MDNLTNRSSARNVRQFARQTSGVLLAIVACGCVTGRPGSQTTQRIQDPQHLSPFARPLTQTPPYNVQRPALPEQDAPHTPILPRQSGSPSNRSLATGGDQPLNGPSLGVPTPEDRTAPPPSSLEPPVDGEGSRDDEAGGVRPADERPLVVTADSPEDAMVGDEVTFSLTIRNARDKAVEAVTAICSLPDGLVNPGKTERAFRRDLGRLEPHAEQAVDLVLRCEESGWNCVEFQVSGEGIDKVATSACVAVRDRSVKLDLSGPSERAAGSRAEYVITMANLTGREQPDVHVILEHEGVLQPREASTGVQSSPGRLEWDLGLVRVDERVQIQAEFACDSPTERTCLAARATGRDLDPREVTSCLQVFPRREIDVDVADEQDPVAVGEKVVYVVRVTNRGLQQVSDLMLEIEPDGLQPLGVLLDEVDVLASADFDPQTGILRVPMPQGLSVDETRTITLQTAATHAGHGRLRVTVRQSSGSLHATIAESTVVNPLVGSIAAGNP